MNRIIEGESTGTHLRKTANEIRTVARNTRNNSIARSNVFWSISISLIMLIVFGVMILLSTSEEVRRTFIQKFGSGWTFLNAKEPEFYRLPAPRTDLPHFLAGASSSDLEKGYSGDLVDEELPLEDVTNRSREEVFEIPTKDPDFEKAFSLLVQNSEFIEALVSGKIPDLLFHDWEPIRAAHPSYWLTFEVRNIVTGEAVKLAWSFDIDTLKSKPENQSARDKFFKMKLEGN